MFNKTMVCLDGSELAEQVLPYAEEQAVRFRGSLLLFHVAVMPSIMAPGVPGVPGEPVRTDGMIEREQRDERMGQNYLEHLAEPLRARGIPVDCVALPGTPGEVIVSYARQTGVDLIALATHGRSGLERIVFGSVAEHVLRNSQLPILLIKPARPV